MAAPDHSPRVAQRRQRILGAAALCFAKDGFARTRIDDVAASAGVSRALVYNHFGTKEELARQVCDHLLDDWSSAVDRALEDAKTAREAIAAWLRVNLSEERRPLLTALVGKHPDSVELKAFEAAAQGPVGAAALQGLVSGNPANFRARLEFGRALLYGGRLAEAIHYLRHG